MKEFVWINIIFFLNLAFGQVGEKNSRQRLIKKCIFYQGHETNILRSQRERSHHALYMVHGFNYKNVFSISLSLKKKISAIAHIYKNKRSKKQNLHFDWRALIFTCNNIYHWQTWLISNMKLNWRHCDKSSISILLLICFSWNGLLITFHMHRPLFHKEVYFLSRTWNQYFEESERSHKPGTSKLGFGQAKIIIEFVWINIIFFLNLAFGQVGEKNSRQRLINCSDLI
jgi:hypothetical protein